MNRSGSTVHYQIVVDLIESNHLGMSIGWIDNFNSQALETLQNAIARKDKFLVIKCHRYTPTAAALVEAGLAKAVYIYRDVRDVAVSLSRKFFPSIEAVLSDRALESSLENYYGWTSLPNVMISQYELTIGNLSQEVIKIAKYLGISIEKKARSIAQKLSIEEQQKTIQNFNNSSVRLKTGIGDDYYDPVSQLHNRHIYSGQPNQWKDVLSVEQITSIENLAFSWLIDRGYPIATLQIDPSQSASAYFKSAEKLRREPNFAEATRLYKQAILINPKSSQYHHQLGKVLAEQNHFAQAISAYRHAVSLKPNSWLYLQSLETALIQRKIQGLHLK
jgi:tetratricopeptide (TPR) repeat protein